MESDRSQENIICSICNYTSESVETSWDPFKVYNNILRRTFPRSFIKKLNRVSFSVTNLIPYWYKYSIVTLSHKHYITLLVNWLRSKRIVVVPVLSFVEHLSIPYDLLSFVLYHGPSFIHVVFIVREREEKV